MGLTVSCAAACVLGAAANVPAGFYPPFVRRDRIIQSLAGTMIAGPVMLSNEALSRFSAGGLSLAFLLICLSVAAGWTMALGILVTELAWRAGILIN